MKLQILSDLHIDSYSRRGYPVGEIPETDADVILVAGDTSNGNHGMKWLRDEASRLNKPIITIAGNHEYFGQDVLSFDAELANCDSYDVQANKGLKVLQCQSFDIADVRILGCTMWTDYQYNLQKDTIAQSMIFMRDYKEIEAGGSLFNPQVSMDIHAKHRAWFITELKKAHEIGKKVIAMTHHSVSSLSIADKYKDFASNAAFVTDFTDVMKSDFAPTLWVHGHTHEAFDYKVGNTRVVVNPRAYPGEVSSTGIDFAWDKVVNLD